SGGGAADRGGGQARPGRRGPPLRPSSGPGAGERRRPAAGHQGRGETRRPGRPAGRRRHHQLGLCPAGAAGGAGVSWRDNLPAVRGKLLRDEPLAPFTWLRVGGAADVLFIPADADDLADFLKGLDAAVPVTVIGVGSNLIVRDGGVEGVVIRLAGRAFAGITTEGDTITAGAGALDAMVAKASAKAGIA